jgi:cytochrome c oxidase cbb3-type subunit 3
MRTFRHLLGAAGAGLLAPVSALAAAESAAAAGPDTRIGLFWLLLSTLVLVLLVFVLLFVALVMALRPQLRRLYALPTVHDSWSGQVLGLLVGDPRLVTGQDRDVQLDHDYDGITEYDNDLPPWWKYGFYCTILFAIGYLGYYHVAGTGQLQTDEYETEMRQASLLLAATPDDPSQLTTYAALTAPADLAAGKALFATNCAPCHGTSAEGKVGPNLTDPYWLHGGEINHVYKTIKYGVASKGMVAWKGKLAAQQMLQVASYIQSLQGSNPANAKEPQGEKEAPAVARR